MSGFIKYKSMMRRIIYLSIIIALTLAITPRGVDAESADFGVLNYDLNINSEFNVKINIQDLVEAGTVEVVLEYDASLITYLNVASGPIMTPDLGPLTATSSDGNIERLAFAIATLKSSVNGSGELASLNFRSNSNIGSGRITIKSVTVYLVDFMLPPIDAMAGDDILFNISLPVSPSISVLAESWEHGSVDSTSVDYWNLKAVNPKTEFLAGESLCVLSKIQNIKNDHRWKTEFYRDGSLIWTDESPWLDVGDGWDYANSMPTLFNLQAGLGKVVVRLDTGIGYELMSEVYYTVTSNQPVNEYLGSDLCDSWTYGNGNPGELEYWNLQCVNSRVFFEEGQRAYLLSQVGNISVAHEWKFEVYHDNVFLWDYSSGSQNINNDHWSYSNFAPYINNVIPGDYELRIFLKTNQDFVLLDTKNFNVTSIYNNTLPYFADFNNDTFGFIQEDNSSLQNGAINLASIDGRECLEFEKIGDVGDIWHMQTKKIGLEFVNSQLYNGSVWLKAENPGLIYIVVQKDTAPWGNLGLWKAVHVTNEWVQYNLDFTFSANVSASDTRLSVMYGDFDGKIWMDDLAFSESK